LIRDHRGNDDRHGSVESVKEALRGGAFDYSRNRLIEISCPSRTKRTWPVEPNDDEIIGQSEEMGALRR
jgi:hypothetical protein